MQPCGLHFTLTTEFSFVNTISPDSAPLPTRGTIVVDMSALLLLAGRKKTNMSSDKQRTGQMYLDTLYRLADAGFEVVIPEIVLYKAANIYRGREIYALFDDNEYTEMRNAVSKWLRDIDAHPNVKVVSTGPHYVQNFLERIGETYDRAQSNILMNQGIRRAGTSGKLVHVSQRRSFAEVARSAAVHDIAGLQEDIANRSDIDDAIGSYIDAQPQEARRHIVFLSDNPNLSEDTQAKGTLFLKVRRMLHLFERQGLLEHMGFAPGMSAEQHFEAMVHANCEILPKQKTFEPLTNELEYKRTLPQIPASNLFDGLAPALDAAKPRADFSSLPTAPDEAAENRLQKFQQRFGDRAPRAEKRPRLSDVKGGDHATDRGVRR
jgi:hypothetical protein